MKKIAAIVNEYWERSHADLIVTKLCDGYELMWTPLRPHVHVASLHVSDPGPTDVGQDRADARGVRTHSSIERALTRGGEKLAVDGVVLIAERNRRSGRPEQFDERGRPVDRRHESFSEIARVCAANGRGVPVFIDKHLGHNWTQIKDVYDTAREVGIPLMAGSSVPVTVRCPPVQLPAGATVEEIIVLATGGGEPPIFHPLELVQSMIEHRNGHETGVAAVRFLSGKAFWDAWESGQAWSRSLQEAALAAVPHIDGPPRDYYEKERAAGRLSALPELGAPTKPAGREEALLVEYVDGTRLAILLLTGYMLRRSVAMRVRGQDAPLVTWTPTGAKVPDIPMVGAAVPPPGSPKPATWNFDHLAFFIDEFMQTGVSPFPIERTLLTSGIIDAAMTSRHRGGEREMTPHLAIEYHPTR
ncbi:hypothetical protein [Actinopolymorpha alba]|uniref:hypothetical protein n=1 Tax=Actinopolymorpha alba TaxID=533267 RepID=UPI0003704DDD|nr:hypothetical protein [Actinopolymorpha alba]